MIELSDKCLIVTGMHRSNTSYLAKVFQSAGLHLGDHLIPANQFNAEGHFEDQSIVDLHETLISDHQLHTRGLYRPTDEITAIRYTPQDIAKASEAISTLQPEQSQTWGWKDPRTPLFFPLWNLILPKAKYVFIVREPDACVSSLIRRSDAGRLFKNRPDTIWRYYRQWTVTNEMMLRQCHNHPDRCFLIFTPTDLHDSDISLLLNNKIQKWGLPLDLIALGSGYKEQLISSEGKSPMWAKRFNKRAHAVYQELQKAQQAITLV